jgi:hypothetical protein
MGVSSIRHRHHEFFSLGMEVIPVKLLTIQSTGNVVGVVYSNKSQLSENHNNKQ